VLRHLCVIIGVVIVKRNSDIVVLVATATSSSSSPSSKPPDSPRRPQMESTSTSSPRSSDQSHTLSSTDADAQLRGGVATFERMLTPFWRQKSIGANQSHVHAHTQALVIITSLIAKERAFSLAPAVPFLCVALFASTHDKLIMTRLRRVAAAVAGVDDDAMLAFVLAVCDTQPMPTSSRLSMEHIAASSPRRFWLAVDSLSSTCMLAPSLSPNTLSYYRHGTRMSSSSSFSTSLSFSPLDGLYRLVSLAAALVSSIDPKLPATKFVVLLIVLVVYSCSCCLFLFLLFILVLVVYSCSCCCLFLLLFIFVVVLLIDRSKTTCYKVRCLFLLLLFILVVVYSCCCSCCCCLFLLLFFSLLQSPLFIILVVYSCCCLFLLFILLVVYSSCCLFFLLFILIVVYSCCCCF